MLLQNLQGTGRRSALLYGSAGAGFVLYYLAAYTKISGSFDHQVQRDAGANTAVVMIYFFSIFYGFSWNGIPWIFASEVMPNHARTFGNMCVVCFQWVGQFIVVYSTPHTMWGTFLFFGMCTTVSFIAAYLFIPETKGIQLEDMDILFGPEAPIFAKAIHARYREKHQAGETAAAREAIADNILIKNGVIHLEGARDRCLKYVSGRT
ncbi:unnamed protein product [Clonostachys byssicola]|uniref:Major facilitator superfamily (MFS) profile domain-containing protein n=1 Tax=Clonostachys byssicola TaxID=160290 RepID=A0A9N9U6W6_9HYPO|nr:unnamed protein product [Clonostachys byssicola]